MGLGRTGNTDDRWFVWPATDGLLHVGPGWPALVMILHGAQRMGSSRVWIVDAQADLITSAFELEGVVDADREDVLGARDWTSRRCGRGTS